MDAQAAVGTVQGAQAVLGTLAFLQLTSSMYPTSAKIKDGAKYDYIIVGAGTAGCVVANRLTEDPNVNVLLVEAGGDPPYEVNKAGLSVFAQRSRVDWDYRSQADENAFQCHQDNKLYLGLGKVLGGTSSLNGMIYTRGSPHDYNKWAEITGDESWSYSNVLPYFKKSEKMTDERIINSTYGEFHGTEGLMAVTKAKDKELQKFLDSADKVGYEYVLDTNGNVTLGFTQVLQTMANGTRTATANAFISTIKDRKNLHILKHALVTKIIIDDKKKATGIKILTKNKQTIKVKATKEVIVSAGSIRGPQLLMMSGIGPKKELKKFNIPVIADLPVGEALYLHRIVFLVIKTDYGSILRKPSSTMAVGLRTLNASQNYPDYQITIRGLTPFTWLLACVHGYAIKEEICQSIFEDLKGKTGMGILLNDFKKKARGNISLRSMNPEDPPNVNTYEFPADEDDLEEYIRYIQDFQKIVESKYMKKVKGKFVKLQKCASFEDDSKDYWKCYLSCMFGGFHFTGTNPMGPKGSAVVDSSLRVYGVQNLRVVDASIMPTITHGNTMVPTIMIGEKASDMIKKDARSQA